MPDSAHKTDHHDSPGAGHELSDAETRPLTIFIASLAVLLIVASAAMWGMFKYFASRQASGRTPDAPLADSRREPPAPRLDVRPEDRLKRYRATESEIANTYDWVDRGTGIVRIPVDRAIELVAERGLPARTEDRGSRIEDR
jgi:hypothetical protein